MTHFLGKDNTESKQMETWVRRDSSGTFKQDSLTSSVSISVTLSDWCVFLLEGIGQLRADTRNSNDAMLTGEYKQQ